jgi:hypothetical protein
MAVFLDKDSLVPALEQMAGPAVSFVEELGVNAVQLPHTEREISVRGLDEDVEVIGHEAIGVADPVVAFVDVLEGVQEVLTVRVVLKYRLLLVAAGSNMIDGAWIFYAEGTGHDER